MIVIRPSSEGGATHAQSDFDKVTIQEHSSDQLHRKWLGVWTATREQNNRAAKTLARGYGALLFGLICVAAEAVVIVLYAVRFL